MICSMDKRDLNIARSTEMMVDFIFVIRRPPRSTPLYSSTASDVYEGQVRVETVLEQLSEG